MNNFQKIVKNGKGVKVVVFGDIMLDRFLFGAVGRISPEAPVPVVVIETEKYMPGGAANVAANAATLGAHVSLIGIIGDDEAGAKLLMTLRAQSVKVNGIIAERKRATVQKTRIIGGGQHIVRIDQEEHAPLSSMTIEKLRKMFIRAIQTADIILVSDYDKGLITQTMATFLVSESQKRGKRVVVDPKPHHIDFFEGAFLITPNLHEARLATGQMKTLEAGITLQRKTKGSILVTEGDQGMTLFESEKKPLHVPAHSSEVFDVVGAGDTVLSACGVALAAGASLVSAIHIANAAAGVAVRKRGTATVSPDELFRELS